MSRLRRPTTWLAIAAGLVLLRSSVVDWRRVDGPSMTPTLRAGDVVLCNRLAYGLSLPGLRSPICRWSVPAVGEVVVFVSPHDGRCCVKRVGEPPLDVGPLPAGHVWLVGDCGEQSLDSRTYGSVPLRLVCGRAVLPAVARW